MSFLKRVISGALLFAVCLFGLGKNHVLAQEDNLETDAAVGAQDVFSLGEIEVAGQSDRVANTTVERVYADQMRKFNRDTLATAAELVPGVTIEKFGARNETLVRIRGFDIKHVPIFLDGIPIYVPYDGYPDLNRFTTFDLSQIVVSKGFASTLYGPNTMGGAINMVSKRPSKEFEATGGGGVSQNDLHSYLNLGGKQDLWYFQGSGSIIDSDEFRLSDDFSSVPSENGGARENSYYQDWRVSFKLGLTPNDTDEYALTYIKQHGEKGTPPYTGSAPGTQVRYWQWPYWDKESVYLNSHTQILDKHYVKTRAFYDEFKNSLKSYDDATYSTMTRPYTFDSRYDDHTFGGSLEFGTEIIPNNTLKLAAHFKQDNHSEIGDKGDPRQHFKENIYSVGVEDIWDVTERFYVIAGASYDWVSTKEAEDLDSSNQIVDFDKGDASAFNPQIGFFYKVVEDGVVHATVARKSRLPTIKDKYSYRLGTALPNADLDPERSINYEIGYEQLLLDKKLSLQAAVFYYDISDFILFKTVPDPSNPGSNLNQNHNVGDVDQYGFEVGASVRDLAGFSAGANYSHLSYDNKSSSDKLTGVPEHKAFAYLGYELIDGLTVLGDVQYNSSRYSSTDGVRETDDFTLVGVKLAYSFLKHYTLEAGAANLLDVDYAYDEGFPEPGRNFYGNIRFAF